MKTSVLILTTIGLKVLLPGCQNPDGTQNNAGSGALTGGAMGMARTLDLGGRPLGLPVASSRGLVSRSSLA